MNIQNSIHSSGQGNAKELVSYISYIKNNKKGDKVNDIIRNNMN
jgi:hypothetical protein